MDGWQFKKVASSSGDPAELQPWDDGGSLTLGWSDDRPEGLCLLHFSVFLSMGSRCRCPTSAPSGVFSKFSGLVFSDHFNTHVCPCVPSPLGYIDQWYPLACCRNALLLSLCLTAVLDARGEVTLPLHSDTILHSEQILALKSGVIQGRAQPEAAFSHSVG